MSRLLSAVLALVRRAPGYFIEDLRPWSDATSLPAQVATMALDEAMLRRWGDAQLAHAPAEPLACLSSLARVAARALVNQRHVPFRLNEGIHTGRFWWTNGARLVRGFASCEGQNLLLARLLARRLPAVTMMEVRGEHSHTLTCVRLDQELVAVDAFHAEHTYALGPSTLLRSVAQLRASGLGEHEGAYPPESYASAVLTPLGARWQRGRWRRDSEEPGWVAARVVSTPWWRAYLEARAHHLFGAPAEARARYEALVGGAPESWLEQVVAQHRERLDMAAPW